jgi:hypothetical protein
MGISGALQHNERDRAPLLLNLSFYEFHMLAHDGIVFLHFQLFRFRARVLLGHIEETGAGGAVEADFDGGWLSHGSFPGKCEGGSMAEGGGKVKPFAAAH